MSLWRIPIPNPREQVPSVQDDMALLVFAAVVFAVMDQLLRLHRPLADTYDSYGRLVKRNQYRYFAIHAIANLYVVCTHLPDVLDLYADPVYNYAGMTNTKGTAVGFAVHFYHIIAFRPLPPVDWVHHIVMLFMGGFAYAAAPGPLLGHGVFYVTGLPGMIDYILLVGVACGWVHRLTEKRINAVVQSWVRLPGVLAHVVFSWICSLDYATRVVDGVPLTERSLLGSYTWMATALTMLAFYWNAIYFQVRVVRNTALSVHASNGIDCKTAASGNGRQYSGGVQQFKNFAAASEDEGGALGKKTRKKKGATSPVGGSSPTTPTAVHASSLGSGGVPNRASIFAGGTCRG